MNLRKTIKQRTFYDDKDYRDPHQDQVYRALPTPPEQPAYKGQVVEYNPALRPAAFPTLSLGQVVAETGKEVTTHSVSEWREVPLTRPEVTATANAPASAQIPPSAPSQDTHPTDTPPELQPENPNSVFDVSGMFTSLDQKEWFRRLSPARSPSLERLTTVVDAETPIYAKNMALMEALSQRTDEEWAEVEMATSDEEGEEEGIPRSRQKIDVAAPDWDKLSVNVQLDILDSVSDGHDTLEAAFKALRLKPQQRLAMLHHILNRNEYLEDEEQLIVGVTEETNRRLLTGNKRDLDHFMKSGHKRLLRKHLYNPMAGIDYRIATRKDLALAESYLATCGITLSLDHWVNAENRCDNQSRKGSEPTELSDTSQPRVPTAQNRQQVVRPPRQSNPVMPVPAAFPTHPVPKDVETVPSATQHPQTTTQPVAKVRKPTGLLKAAPRRRSMFPQARAEERTLQEKNQPAVRPQSNGALKGPQDTRIDGTLSDKQSLKPQNPQTPPPRQPYQPPPLALPFSLPALASNHQQLWLPNSEPPSPSPSRTAKQRAVTAPKIICRFPPPDDVSQVIHDPHTAILDDAQHGLPLSHTELSQDPDRPIRAASPQQDYNGDIATSTPAAIDSSHDAYEQLRQQTSHQPDPPIPSHSQVEGQTKSVQFAVLPPPLGNKIGTHPHIHPQASSPLMNPYALAYHTADYGIASNASATAQVVRQAAPMIPETETGPGQHRQSGADPSAPALPTPGGTPESALNGTPESALNEAPQTGLNDSPKNGEGAKAQGKHTQTVEDKEREDDEYVPLKKKGGRARKAPVKATTRKRRKTMA